MKIKVLGTILTLSTVVIAGGIGWRVYWGTEQKQVYIAAHKLIAQADLERRNTDIKAANVAYRNLEEAVAILESIPSSTSNVYQTAQADLLQLRPRLEQLKQRLMTEQDSSVNFKLSQKIAMEAAILVQNPPHPDSVWQQAQTKWQQAINFLSTIPPETTIYPIAQQRLTSYQANYAAISRRFNNEQKAVNNLNTATKLGIEISQLVQNQSYSLSQGKEAVVKCQKVINLLQELPAGTSVGTSTQVQTMLESYQKNCAAIADKTAKENQAQTDIETAQKLAAQAVELTKTTPYTVEILRNALVKLSQASNLLKSIPQELDATQKAISLRPKYVSIYTKIHSRFKEVELCQRQNLSYCVESEISLNLEN